MSNTAGNGSGGNPGNPVTAESFRYVRELVHRQAAIVLEPGKEYLVESRLTPIAKELGASCVNGLVARMRDRERTNSSSSLALTKRVIDALTTNETLFFRDVHPFETLHLHIVPAFVAAGKRRLNIWCAAASTGQEPYSVAMTIARHCPDVFNGTRILATDLNASVLERAQRGVYRQLEVNRGLPAAMLVKYFERDGADFRVQAAIRSAVDFRQLNLLSDWPFAPASQDIIMMRNVLIYFDAETKYRLVKRATEALVPNGVLFLGSTETLSTQDQSTLGLIAERLGPTTVFRRR